MVHKYKTSNNVAFVLLLVVLSFTDAQAEVKKKVGVEPFQNPEKWAGRFDPGRILTDLIKNAVASKPEFRLVPDASWLMPIVDDKVQDDSVSEPVDNKVKQYRHPAQLLVHGRVLSVSQKKVAGNKNAIAEEQTDLLVEVVLTNTRTTRIVATKYFRKDAIREVMPTKWIVDVNLPQFRNSSIGAAMELILNDIMSYVHETLWQMPFDADIVEVDEKNSQVVINAGAIDGIKPYEIFKVYWQVNHYQDAGTQADLGDRLLQKGVIKIESVQEDFAVGRILVGSKFKAGSLVRRSTDLPIWAKN